MGARDEEDLLFLKDIGATLIRILNVNVPVLLNMNYYFMNVSYQRVGDVLSERSSDAIF